MASPSAQLIVVCCHAIYLGSAQHDAKAGTNEETDWLIEPFQEGETQTFVSHIEKGVEQLRTSLNNGVDAVLVFSGGATKTKKGCQISEGESYLVSRHLPYDSTDRTRHRSVTDQDGYCRILR